MDHLADVPPVLVEVEHLDEIRAVSGEFGGAERIHMQLIPRHLLSLCAVGWLEIDDRDLVGCQSLHQIDTAIHRDARRDMHVDLLLGVDGSG